METVNSQVRVVQIGDGLFIPLPEDVVKATNIRRDSLMNLEVGDDKARVTPAALPEYTLDELLEGMTPAHFHQDIDTGPPVGKEVW